MTVYPRDLDLFDRWRAWDHDPEHWLYLSDDDLVAHMTLSTGYASFMRESAFKDALARCRGSLGYPMDTIPGYWGDNRFDFDFRKHDCELGKYEAGRTGYAIPVGKHKVAGAVEGFTDTHTAILVGTTDRAIELDGYFDSWEWRAALAGFSSHPGVYVQYELFRVAWAGGKRIDVKDSTKVRMYPYEGLREELEERVHQFATIMSDIGWNGR